MSLWLIRVLCVILFIGLGLEVRAIPVFCGDTSSNVTVDHILKVLSELAPKIKVLSSSSGMSGGEPGTQIHSDVSSDSDQSNVRVVSIDTISIKTDPVTAELIGNTVDSINSNQRQVAQENLRAEGVEDQKELQSVSDVCDKLKTNRNNNFTALLNSISKK